MRVLLAIALSTTLLACGGGGGGGGSLPGALTASDDGSAPGTSNPSMPGNPGNPGAPSSPAATPDGPDFASIGPDPMAVLPARDTPLTVVAATRGSRSSGIPRTPGGEPGNIDRVTAYALSDNSWVAMAIDVVADGSGANILFRGMFGELQAIARSGDQLAGFPSNVTLGASNEILVLDDSTIYVNADLQGAVERNSEALVRVAPDGSLTGLLRQGQLLETSIRGETVDDFEFLSSSGENVFAGVETNQGNRYVVQLNGDVPQIIVRGVGSNNFMNTEGQPSIGNCFIQAIDIQNGQIFTNNTGAIAFAADLQIDSAEACPRVAIVQYEDGEFSYIWNPVGNLVAIGDSNFTNLDMLGFADDGTAYVEVIAFRDGADIVRSVWVADGVNSPRMVALEGETLPPNFDPGAVIESRGFFDSTNSRIDTRLAVANNRQFSMINSSGFGDVLLSGNARTDQPYESLYNPGASQLSRIAATVTDPVPGLGGDSFFTLIETPRMHNSGALWFVADATDGSGESSAFSGLWRADPGATPAPLVSYADVLVSGEAVTLREILSYRVNRVGDVLMAARTSTSAIAWIYKRGSQ